MKKLQLLLTNPCSKQWGDMQQAGTGRYCDHCEKHIVDLTDKSDAELLQFFKKKKDNVCGRLLSSQLNRELVVPSSKSNWQWLLPLAIGAVAAFPGNANELRPLIVHSGQTGISHLSSVNLDVKSPKPIETIHGQVVDNRTGNPLKGVKIKQKGFENVLALTDSTGRFELANPEGKIATIFIFELPGYEKVEVQVSEARLVKMVEQRIMLGGISTAGVTKNPFYMVYSGDKSCALDPAKISKIFPEWIETIEVLKGAKATALYGAKAANGAILIRIKEAYQNKINFSKKTEH